VLIKSKKYVITRLTPKAEPMENSVCFKRGFIALSIASIDRTHSGQVTRVLFEVLGEKSIDD